MLTAMDGTFQIATGLMSMTATEVAANFYGYNRASIPTNLDPDGLYDNGATFRQVDVIRAKVGTGELQFKFVDGHQFNGWGMISVSVVGYGEVLGCLWESANQRFRTHSNAIGLAAYLRDNPSPFIVSIREGG